MDNLKVFNGKGEKNELSEVIRNLKETITEQIELQIIVAQLQKARFDELKKQGFSDNHAIELCQKIF